MTDTNKTDAAAQPINHHNHTTDRPGELLTSAVAAAEDLRRPTVVSALDPRDGTEIPLVLIPDGDPFALNPAHFDKYRGTPIRREGTVDLTTAASFVEIVKRFRNPSTAIFASDDRLAPSLTAIFDYHPGNAQLFGEENEGDVYLFGPPAADNCAHRAKYNFPISEEWNAWADRDGANLTMIEFAQFLEDRIVDVQVDTEVTGDAQRAYIKAVGGIFATPTKLMEMARTLEIHESSSIKEARKLTSGESEISFASEHHDSNGDKLVVPSLFIIAIPVFAGSSDYFRMLARLRYRKRGPNITFKYELWRPELIFDTAVSEACEEVAAKTEQPVYFGRPEKV